MAAYITGTATGPGAVDNFVLALQSALTGNGWTLHDTVSATVGARDLVFKSTAIDATAGNACYLRIVQTALTTFKWNIYSDWDTTANAGANEAGVTTSVTLSDSTFAYFIRVNEYAIAVCTKISSTYSKGYAGFLRRGLPASKAGCTKTTSAYSAGVSAMSVASDMTTKLKVGQKVLIYNQSHNNGSANFGNAEVVTLLTVAAGSLTFTAPTTKDYDNEAIIGQFAYPGVVGALTNVASMASLTHYRPFALDGTRTGNTTHLSTPIQTILVTEANADPGDVYPEYASGLIGLSTSEASKTGFLGYMYHWECAAAGTQSLEDLMDDGDNTYIVLALNGTTDVLILGPQ